MSIRRPPKLASGNSCRFDRRPCLFRPLRVLDRVEACRFASGALADPRRNNAVLPDCRRFVGAARRHGMAFLGAADLRFRLPWCGSRRPSGRSAPSGATSPRRLTCAADRLTSQRPYRSLSILALASGSAGAWAMPWRGDAQRRVPLQEPAVEAPEVTGHHERERGEAGEQHGHVAPAPRLEAADAH